MIFFTESVFDHCPCVVNMDAQIVSKPKPFRYFNMWAKVGEFDSIVQNVWNQVVQGVKMYKIVDEIEKSEACA